METKRQELTAIIEEFAASGWDLIAVPAKAWLSGNADKAAFITAVQQADQECGSCGCELDPLYKRFLSLKDEL